MLSTNFFLRSQVYYGKHCRALSGAVILSYRRGKNSSVQNNSAGSDNNEEQYEAKI